MDIATLTLIALAALAFANGSNDVSKGVATLAGSGRASYRTAVAWGTCWTVAGACAAVLVTSGIVTAFTTALVNRSVLEARDFAVAVAAGAAGWVLMASRLGVPVSTTHALTGAIVGVAVVIGGMPTLNWWALVSGILMPLALSPLASALIAFTVRPLAVWVSPACVCVEEVPVVAAQAGGAAVARTAPRLVASAAACDADGSRWRVAPGDLLHWSAAAALSFARAVNDTPKIAAFALVAVASQGSLVAAVAVVAMAMAAGSYVAGMRVTRALGDRVVHMNGESGLASAVVASGLVLAASFHAMPVSTTHVAAGATIGAGLRQDRGAVDWRTVRTFLSAWIVTLPGAAMLAAAAVTLLRLVGVVA